MGKLKCLFRVLIAAGGVLFLGGIFLSMKELMEYGICAGVAGVIGYAVLFVIGSTSLRGKKLSD
ncbi:MAG: hypothetical protein Kow0089_08540 [Desulfobulbaceae bacterium]